MREAVARGHARLFRGVATLLALSMLAGTAAAAAEAPLDPDRAAGAGAREAAATPATGVGARDGAATLPRGADARLAAPRPGAHAVAPDGAATTVVPPEAQRPDVVLLVLDDLGPLDGRLWEYLPNIRQTWIEQGVGFEHMYGETPLCCPGRAGFLTGLHSHNHGVHRNDVREFDPSVTLATALDAVGYHTFAVGKYFNKYRLIAPAIPPGWDHFHALGPAYYDYPGWHHGVKKRHGIAPEAYHTDVTSALAVEHLAGVPADEPFFAWIGTMAPHGPLTPAPRHLDDTTCEAIAPWQPPNYDEVDVSDKPLYIRESKRLRSPSYDLRATCRTMLAVDELVGAVRAELQRQGRLERTLFVLSADNGMNFGAHRRYSKWTPYATHIPFFVSWPGVLGTQPRTHEELVSNIDVAPTVCELAGCTLGPFASGQAGPDGRSFAALLLGLEEPYRRDALLESLPSGARPVIPRWYAVRTSATSDLAWTGCAEAATGGCRWHYVRYSTGEQELYDLSNGPCWTWQPGEPGDPCELQSLHADPAYASLRSALAVLRRELKAEGRGG